MWCWRYLTEGYDGAPYGLSIVVPTQPATALATV